MQRTLIGIVLNGVTGRMGYRQHLVRSLLAIREQGGLPARDGSRIWPELTLVGRNEAKLAEIAARHGLTSYTTDLEAALADESNQIYFDAQVTSERERAIRAAIAPESTSTRRSLSPRGWPAPWNSPGSPPPRGSRTGWCRTSCSSPACAS